MFSFVFQYLKCLDADIYLGYFLELLVGRHSFSL